MSTNWPIPAKQTQPVSRFSDDWLPVQSTAPVVGLVHMGLKYGNQLANEYLPPSGQTALGASEFTAGWVLRRDERPEVRAIGVTLQTHGLVEGLVGLVRALRSHRD